MATIKVKSKLDSRNYKKGIDEMKRQNGTFAKGLGAIKGKLAAAFAVGAVMAGLKKITGAAINAASELSRMTDQAGVSQESLQKLGQIARNAGEDLDTVRDALGAIRTAQGEVLRGDEGMVKEFEELGISLEEIASMDVDELFARIGKALEETGNDAGRFAAAAKIIGEGDVIKLQEVFEGAAKGLNKMGVEMGSMTEIEAAIIENSRRRWSAHGRYVVNYWGKKIARIIGVSAEAEAILDKRDAKRAKSAERRSQNLKKLEDTRLKAQADEELKAQEKAAELYRKQVQKIEETVKVDIKTDSIRRIGGVAGSSVSQSLNYARQQTEIMVQLAEYEASLPNIEKNTQNQGLA